MSHASQFLSEAKQVIDGLDVEAIERMAVLWRRPASAGGRCLYWASRQRCQASHAVNDFRKIVGIEAYAPTDNVSELTARTNDEGWPTIFVEWLRVSRLNPKDLTWYCRSAVVTWRRTQPEPRHGATVRERGRHTGDRHRRPGRRLHGQVAAACAIVPTVNPSTSRPIPRRSKRWSGTCWSRTRV